MSESQGLCVGMLYTELTVDVTNFYTTLEKSKDDVESVGETFGAVMGKNAEAMKKAGKALTDGFTKPLLKGVLAVTDMGLELDAADARFGRVFGKWTGHMDGFIEEWQTLVPITQTGAQNMAVSMEEMLASMGFMREEAVGLTEVGMTLAGAWANFNSATVTATEAGAAYQAMLAGEYEALSAVGVQITAAAVEQKALEMGLSGSNGQLSAQAQAIAATQIAWEQSAGALSAFGQSQLDAKTKMGVAKAALHDELAVLGQYFIPIVLKGVNTLSRLVAAFNNMTPAGKKTVAVFTGIAAAAGPLKMVMSQMITSGSLMRTTLAGQNRELDKNTVKTLMSIMAQKGQGAALFQAGMMATGKAAAVAALGISENAATPPTYALGAAVRFATGPFTIVLGLLGALIPLMTSFGKKADETAGQVGDAALSMEELEGSLEGIGDNVKNEDMELDLEVQVSIDRKTASREIETWKTDTLTAWAEYLMVAIETEKNITAVVEEEYKKRTNTAVLELEKRKAQEISAYLEYAAMKDLPVEDVNAHLVSITEKFDKEIEITIGKYGVIQDALLNHYDAEKGFTAEALTEMLDLNSAYLNDLGENEQTSMNSMADHTLYTLRSVNEMTDQELLTNKAISEEHKTQIISDAQAVRDEKVRIAQNALDTLPGYTEEMYAKDIAIADNAFEESKRLANAMSENTLTAIEDEMLKRRVMEEDNLNAVISANGEMEAENARHTARLDEINKEHDDKLAEHINNGAEGFALIGAMFFDNLQTNKKIEVENQRHSEAEQRITKEISAAWANLDTESLEHWISIYNNTCEKGGEVTEEMQTTADLIKEAFEGLPTEFEGYASDTISGFVENINQKLWEMTAAGENAAYSFLVGFNSVLEIKSPSRAMARAADFTADGFEIQWKKRETEILTGMMDFSSLIVDRIKNDVSMNSSTTNSFTNHNSQNFSNTINVAGGISALAYRREVNRLIRQQAAMIAK